MKNRLKKIALVGCMVLMTSCLNSVSSEAKLIPKATNFIILVDQSGSMLQEHATLKKVKATLTKTILLEMNERIPDLGYNAALQVFAPDRTLAGPAPYRREAYRESIRSLPEEGEIAGKLTPLGPAIEHLDKIMNRFTGKTAIIIVSDGKANLGKDPVKAARMIANEYTNICFHIISLADNEKGRKNLREISAVRSCTFVDGAALLSDTAAMDLFVNDVFYLVVPDEKPFEASAVAAAVQAEESPRPMVFQDVLFDFDKYDLKAKGEAMLAEAVKLLENSNSRLMIEGHTDWDGPDEYNQVLSERRARAVFEYFTGKGIAADRMEAKGYGEKMPRISNLTPEGRAINRRVEIKAVDTP